MGAFGFRVFTITALAGCTFTSLYLICSTGFKQNSYDFFGGCCHHRFCKRQEPRITPMTRMKFGVRGHVRAIKAAPGRRTPKRFAHNSDVRRLTSDLSARLRQFAPSAVLPCYQQSTIDYQPFPESVISVSSVVLPMI
jgi:hypothetical protein